MPFNEKNSMIGKNGVSLTDICPRGKVLIDGIVFVVYTNSVYIPQNTPITIVGISKRGLLVSRFRAVEQNTDKE